MKLKDGIIVEKVGNEYIAVATGELSRDFHGIIRGNVTMNFILSRLGNCQKRCKNANRKVSKCRIN